MEANNIDEVITISENDSVQLFKWFSENQMKVNKDKCYVDLVISNNEKVCMKINNIEIENTSNRKIFRHNK